MQRFIPSLAQSVGTASPYLRTVPSTYSQLPTTQFQPSLQPFTNLQQASALNGQFCRSPILSQFGTQLGGQVLNGSQYLPPYSPYAQTQTQTQMNGSTLNPFPYGNVPPLPTCPWTKPPPTLPATDWQGWTADGRRVIKLPSPPPTSGAPAATTTPGPMATTTAGGTGITTEVTVPDTGSGSGGSSAPPVRASSFWTEAAPEYARGPTATTAGTPWQYVSTNGGMYDQWIRPKIDDSNASMEEHFVDAESTGNEASAFHTGTVETFRTTRQALIDLSQTGIMNNPLLARKIRTLDENLNRLGQFIDLNAAKEEETKLDLLESVRSATKARDWYETMCAWRDGRLSVDDAYQNWKDWGETHKQGTDGE